MSSLYNLEPQPTASCILHTTSGDISLELWAQQTPLTCRNFLQHCLDGYYDGTIFHRLVPGFILQGGDPTGTGSGGESIYDGGAFDEPREQNGIWPQEERKGKNAGPHGVGFKDEFHSRLKFNRRGLLGMANEGPDSNGSQFFLTLGDTPELQGKNSLFGRVVGDTIYNVARMGESEVEGDRPLYPVKITDVEVLVNPFKDMVGRTRIVEPITKEKPISKLRKRKGGKQLLSFGGEDGEIEEQAEPVVKRTKFDTRIVMDTEQDNPMVEAKNLERSAEKTTKKPISESPPEPLTMPKTLPSTTTKSNPRGPSSSPEPQAEKVTPLLERTNAQIAELKASMRRNTQKTALVREEKSALERMIPENSIRGRKRGQAGQTSSGSDQQALAILKAFQSKLDAAPPEKDLSASTLPLSNTDNPAATNEEDEEATLCDLHFIANCQSCKSWDIHGDGVDPEEEDDRGWMSHALSFKADKLGKDLSYRKKAEEELVVIDPRQKSKTLKEEKRAEREAKSGGSGRAWDRERNERLARASNLAGRGAK
jgi:peptidyl-prolyl cis-trans isomerase SDCCAG10